MRGFDDILRDILLFAPPFILSLSFHEYAHAWTAYRFGDSTAKFMGRLTMDPMAHISLMGTIIFPAISIAMGGIFFGWANPVPVDMRNFKKPRQHMAVVALAGPVSNMMMAFMCTALLAFLLRANPGDWMNRFPSVAVPVRDMILIAIQLNLMLAFFNLIPLPPLDGSRIVQGLIPSTWADKIDGLAPQAQMILILLLFTGVFRMLLGPVNLAFNILMRIFHLM